MAISAVISKRPAVVSRAARATFYRPELDVFRFFAFFAVYLTHSLPHHSSDWIRYHLPGRVASFTAAIAASGSFGVQLFFLLSAYLITALLLREKELKASIELRAFYIRRILRIWPLYFFILLVAVCWPWSGRLPLPYFVAFALLVGNWMSVIVGPPASWAMVLWSVSIEEQFYLSWPLFLKFASRKGRIRAAAILIVIANVVRVYLSLGSPRSYTVYANTFAELDVIGVGILCAIAFKNAVPVLRTRERIVLALAGFAILVSCGYFVDAMSRTFVIAGYPSVTAGCLALFLAVCGTSISWRWFVYLGKISYGLYVYHLLALRLVGDALRGRTSSPIRFLAFWCGGLLLTVAFASASYRWLETPFLELKERFATVKSRPV